MTRFARAVGSKASNQRCPDEGTPWSMLKQQLGARNHESENDESEQDGESERKSVKFEEKKVEENQNSTWHDFEEVSNKNYLTVAKSEVKKNEKTKNIKGLKEKEKLCFDLKSNECIFEQKGKQVKLNGKDSTKSVIIGNKKKKEKRGHNKPAVREYNLKMSKKRNSSVEEVINIASFVDENMNSSNKRCYLCNKEGHKLSACPRIKGKDIIGSICYKCGVKGHSRIECEDKSPYSFKYAVCLNCQEKGHIARNCTTKASNNYINKRTSSNDMKIAKIKRKKRGPFTLNINGCEMKIVNYDGFPIKIEDARRIEDLRQELISRNVNEEEIQNIIKKERRRAEHFLARTKKKVCFHCRSGGHNLSSCPKLEENGVQTFGYGICYKCGSTEHSYLQCKVSINGNSYKFAVCFICKETGHIAKECPDNPRGLYPKGGGCKICGDVTHFKRDCPEGSDSNKLKIGIIQSNDVEALEESMDQMNMPKVTKKKKKVVKFI